MSQSSSLISEHVKCLLESRIHLISEEWVNNVWDGDFTDLTCDWPDELADRENNVKYWGRLLANLLESCQEWPHEQPGFWLSMVENEVSPRAVIAFLYCIMEKYPKQSVGVLAAHIYLIVNPIVGSSAYKVFHSLLFEKAINFARLLSSQLPGNRKAKKVKPVKGSKKRAAPSGRSSRRAQQASVEDSDDDEDGSVACDDGEQDSNAPGACIALMQDFALLVDVFSLKVSEHCLQQILAQYVELLHTQESVKMSWSDDRQSISSCTSPPRLAAITLLKLCQPFHGAPTASVLSIFKQLRAVFLMNWLTAQSGSLPEALTASSKLALHVTRHMVETYLDTCLAPLQILIQHLCASSPARSDMRSRLAQTVVELMALLPPSSRIFMIEWLCKYAKSNKTSHRVFACDVICHVLQHPLPPVEGDLSDDDRLVLSDMYLLRCVFSRCSDKAASVRSHALSVVAEVGAKLKGSVTELLREVTSNGPGPFHVKMVVPMVIRRSGDEKAGVRKSSLQLLELLISVVSESSGTEMLRAISDRCRDPALSVRKQALSSLSNLLECCGASSRMQRLWLEAVLPLVLDSETSVKQRCCQLLYTFMLEPIEPADVPMTVEQQRAWRLLSHIASAGNTEMRRYFQRVVSEWAIDRCLTSALQKSVLSHRDGDNSKTAWMLLADISLYCPLRDVQFVLDAWKQIQPEDCDPELASSILSVMTGCCNKLSSFEKSKMKDNLLRHLLAFKSELSVVASMVQTMAKLNSEACEEDPSQAVRQQWAVDILEACGNWLSQNILQESRSAVAEKDLVRRLFTLGEAAQLCPACVSEQLFLLVQSLLATPKELSASQSSFTSAPLVRAHAFLTLGKLCLQQEVLAKKCVSVLVRELETSDDPVVRNNVVIILCDLCVRYTQLVDNHLTSISACLCDESALVSHQTLMSLTILLKEDYIKLKGSLFFRYLMCIVSENSKSCQYAEYCLVHLLLARHQILFSSHFVESLFHYNGYDQHTSYNKFPQTEKERSTFSLSGEKGRPKRRIIFRFLLEHMTDEQRFGITAKLCQEVLSDAVDGTLSLRGSGSAVLADALYILCCPEIKLSSLRVQTTDDMEDEVEQAAAAAANAKSKLVTQLVRKNVMENIVPIVIDLKHLLEQKRSPLLRNVMQFLQELMKDYRNDVQDILSADRQLAREIEYDLKKFEEEETKAKEANLSRPPTLTPHAPLASPLVTTPARRSPHAFMSPAAGFSAPRVRGACVAPATPAEMLQRSMRKRALATLTSAARTPGLSARTRLESARKLPSSSAAGPDEGSPTLILRPTQSATPHSQRPSSIPCQTPGVKSAKTSVPTQRLLASVGPPVMSRAVSTPQRLDVGNTSLSFRDSLSGLIPPSPILPMSRVQKAIASSAAPKRTADGQPLLSIPNLQNQDPAQASQWPISPTTSRPAGLATVAGGQESEPVTRAKRSRPSRSENPRAKSSRVVPQPQPVVEEDVSDRANTPDPSSISPAPSPKRNRAETSRSRESPGFSGPNCSVVIVRHPSPVGQKKTKAILPKRQLKRRL